MEKLPRRPTVFGASRTCWWDAGARDFETVDPASADIIKTPPAISFTVNSAKFQGRVTVL